MSGHSKWAKIKRQKGANDANKGQVYTKLARELMVAAREGGGDPDGNVRLRLAIRKAREANMPAENIERAIKKAIGGGEGAALEEITYEGYAPGGAALLIQAMTDNRNRTVSEIRAAFTKVGGSLGENGSVAWLFESRGIVAARVDGKDPEEVALLAIDAGAEDVQTGDGAVEIYTQPSRLDDVRQALEREEIPIDHAESTMLPKTTVDLPEEIQLSVLKLIDRLEDLDDVQKVYTNAKIDDAVVEKHAG